MATIKEQHDLLEKVILGTRRNTITWKEEGDKLSALVTLKDIESQREIRVVLSKEEKEPHYKMVFNFVEHNSQDLFEVSSLEYQELGRFGDYMFKV